MIQRIQTIWLLLAAITAFLMTRLPLYKGTGMGVSDVKFMATENLLVFAILAIAGLLALIALVMFKKRPLQIKLSWFGLLASIALIALEVWQIDTFKKNNSTLTNSSYAFGSLLPIAMMVFFILAIRNIRKDEKLVKSLERFR